MFKVFQTVFVVLMMWAGASHAATTVNVDCSTGTVEPANPPQDTEVTLQLTECNNMGIAKTLSNVVAELNNGASIPEFDFVQIGQVAGCRWDGNPATTPPCNAIKITSSDGGSGTYSLTFKDSQGDTTAGPVSGSISASGGGSGGGGSAATPVPALPLLALLSLGGLLGFLGLRKLRQ